MLNSVNCSKGKKLVCKIFKWPLFDGLRSAFQYNPLLKRKLDNCCFGDMLQPRIDASRSVSVMECKTESWVLIYSIFCLKKLRIENGFQKWKSVWSILLFIIYYFKLSTQKWQTQFTRQKIWKQTPDTKYYYSEVI